MGRLMKLLFYCTFLFLLCTCAAQTSSGDKHGKALEKQGKSEEAIEQYRRALASNPNDLRAHLAICRILRAKENHQALADEYRSWVDSHPTDFSDVSQLAAELGRFLYDQELAIDVWEDYLSQTPPPATGATAHNALGQLLLERERYSEAVSELRRATHLQSDEPDFHRDLADALEAQGDLNGALQEHRAESYLAPDRADAHYAIAEVLRKLGDFEGELTEYRAALSVSSSKSFARVKLAILLQERGDTIAAEAQYKQAMVEYPENTYAQVKLAKLMPTPTADSHGTKVTALQKHDSPASSNNAVNKLAKNDQSVDGSGADAAAHYRLGIAALAYKDYQLVEVELRDAIRLDPTKTDYHKVLGLVLVETGEQADAIRELKAGIRSGNPLESAVDHHALGLLLLKWKKNQEAIEEFSRAYTLLPTNLTFRTDYERTQSTKEQARR